MNMFHFSGNLGKDATLRQINGANGPLSVANFSVAVKSGFGQNETTVWVACSLFGRRADALVQYLTKGTKVCACGEVSLRQWTNNAGELQTSLDVRVSEITLMGSPQQAQGGYAQQPQGPAGGHPQYPPQQQGGYQQQPQGPAGGRPPAPAHAPGQAPDLSDDPYDDDIPF